MLYFSADQHFGHENIIKLCNRPFSSIEEMDEELIKNWNQVIRPKDVVWHLGDFVYKSEKSVEWYLEKLNGKIHIVWGNHDHKYAKKCADRFESCHDIAELKFNKQRFVMCHYPFASWRNSCRGSIHCHGHTHCALKSFNMRRMDVGVDCTDYKPISIHDVIKKMTVKEFCDV